MLARAKRIRAKCPLFCQGKTSLPIWPGQNVSARWHPGQNVTQGKTSQGRTSPNHNIQQAYVMEVFSTKLPQFWLANLSHEAGNSDKSRKILRLTQSQVAEHASSSSICHHFHNCFNSTDPQPNFKEFFAQISYFRYWLVQSEGFKNPL